MSHAELIAKLKKIAEDNYNKGGDVFVECYDDSDWQEFISDITEGTDPVELLYTCMEIYDDRQQDAKNSVW
jgi:hypothetical protein